jgi:lipopolysaccharide transport system ATP-binding protein
MTQVIRLESISKKYYISQNEPYYKTLRESLSSIGSVKKREEFWALRDISMSAESGDTIGIIGENGAGKTTLLKILSKITRPTKGSGRIEGRVASLLEVGTGFHPELTGRENIYLNGVILGLKKKEIDRNFEEIVEFAGIGNFLDTQIKYFSTGMWARLAFSVAAHLEPEILLIDEVLSVGDAEFQRKSLAKMDDLSGSGRTVVFVSHNMPAVRKLCKRCIYLKEGQIKKSGETDEVINEYLSGFSDSITGVTVLTDLKTRKGNLKARFSRIELRNQDDRITGTFRIRDDLNINLFFEAFEKIRNLKIIVTILETTGDTVTTIFDSDSGFSMTNVEGKRHVSLSLKDIRLIPGVYYLSVTLMSEIFNYKVDYYDDIDYAASFRIENHIISNRNLSRQSGLILMTPDWEIHNQ